MRVENLDEQPTWKLQEWLMIRVKSTDLITLFFQTRLNKWLYYMMSFAAFRRFTFPQINKYYLYILNKNNNHIDMSEVHGKRRIY